MKPDDISQECWDRAEIALKFVPAGDDSFVIASVARALIAARQEGRKEAFEGLAGKAARVKKWCEGGGSSWGTPMGDIEALANAAIRSLEGK